MREPSIKKSLFWCPECNVPLIAGTCGCGTRGVEFPLLKPYDVRPALEHDRTLLLNLLEERFGGGKLPKIVLFNKTGGTDRTDLVIANGVRFGWLNFSPVTRKYSFEPSFEALSFILPDVSKNIVDITSYMRENKGRRLGGKKIEFSADCENGCVIIRVGGKWGVGNYQDGFLKVRQFGVVEEKPLPDPDYSNVIRCNKKHLKNIERHAIRSIKIEVNQHSWKRPNANVSFSGGKDSTVVLELAKRAGITDSYFVDTGMEFPQTIEFVESMNIGQKFQGGDFKSELAQRGIPKKDNRWCCERLKLHPVSNWLNEEGGCVTVQGNRWYESFARSGLPAAIENPYNNKQINISPIRSWRALEVFLYIWWRELPYNPLYDLGFERVGCWMCPAMLESEAERVKELLPEKYGEWMEYLRSCAEKNKFPKCYVDLGLWRWDELPPKMVELLDEYNLSKNQEKPTE